MDGVLCDFVSAAFKVHGRTYCESSFPRYVYELEGILKVTTETFWEKIHEHGEDFGQLEPYPWCHELVTWKKLGDVVIATSPSRCHTSYAGKRRWLVNNGPGHLPSMFGAHKHLMAAPGRVLIDDAEHNLKSLGSAAAASTSASCSPGTSPDTPCRLRATFVKSGTPFGTLRKPHLTHPHKCTDTLS